MLLRYSFTSSHKTSFFLLRLIFFFFSVQTEEKQSRGGSWSSPTSPLADTYSVKYCHLLALGMRACSHTQRGRSVAQTTLTSIITSKDAGAGSRLKSRRLILRVVCEDKKLDTCIFIMCRALDASSSSPNCQDRLIYQFITCTSPLHVFKKKKICRVSCVFM